LILLTIVMIFGQLIPRYDNNTFSYMTPVAYKNM